MPSVFDTMHPIECDEFHAVHEAKCDDDEARRVHRQGYAGMIWSCQYYGYDVARWLDGDPGQPPPPRGHKNGRNHEWRHIRNHDVISMPDAWEYPWYATWDSAFQAVTFATIDPEFAKHQLRLFVNDRYMHPNGELPAYEWAFGDVNPPVHAWAPWRTFQVERHAEGGDGRVVGVGRHGRADLAAVGRGGLGFAAGGGGGAEDGHMYVCFSVDVVWRV